MQAKWTAKTKEARDAAASQTRPSKNASSSPIVGDNTPMTSELSMATRLSRRRQSYMVTPTLAEKRRESIVNHYLNGTLVLPRREKQNSHESQTDTDGNRTNRDTQNRDTQNHGRQAALSAGNVHDLDQTDGSADDIKSRLHRRNGSAPMAEDSNNASEKLSLQSLPQQRQREVIEAETLVFEPVGYLVQGSGSSEWDGW